MISKRKNGRTPARPIIVGQAPSRTSDPGSPMSGRPMSFMCRTFGVTERKMKASFRFVNLVKKFPGKNGKGDAFPLNVASNAAGRLMERTRGELLLAGKLVAAAFGINGCEYFRWYTMGSKRVAVFPHPSGINRWWNERRNKKMARRFFRDGALNGK